MLPNPHLHGPQEGSQVSYDESTVTNTEVFQEDQRLQRISADVRRTSMQWQKNHAAQSAVHRVRAGVEGTEFLCGARAHAPQAA